MKTETMHQSLEEDVVVAAAGKNQDHHAVGIGQPCDRSETTME